MLPGATISELARVYGVIERAGKQDLELFVRSLILAAGDGRGGVQADVLRRYVQSTAPEVSRAAFYKWFNPPLEDLMADFANRATAFARALPVDVPAPFNCSRDWHIFDSETVTVRRTAQSEWQGTGDYAAQSGTPAPKRIPVCRRDPANRPRCLQKQESAQTGTPVANAPWRDAVAINCAATGRGTRLRGCPAEVSAQADTVNVRPARTPTRAPIRN